MENKKQLIIIPPMSEALSKLNVVLEGVSADENMEITIIDDLKELTQFLGTTGQCLILASNAKKCATFLQDNKVMLSKFHCKTILFTPKEIPAKTLVKFTKVGLTESILESLPPKTFLYKVKLLLRSIKTAKPQDDAEKTVKSLEAMRALAEDFEKDYKEKSSNEDTPAAIDLADKKRTMESGEVIDYGGNLKGKSKHQDDAIDTNWKSDKKKNSLELSPADEENKESTSEDESSIDMYYRGKQKKNSELFDLDESSSRSKINEDHEESELDIAKKKSSYADVIDEGSMKQKRLESEEVLDELDTRNKSESIELNLEAAKKKRLEELEEKHGSDLLYTESSDSSEEEKKRKKQMELDLDNSLKGKINQEPPSTATDEEASDEMDYDNSEVDRNKRKKDTQLDLIATEKELKQEGNDASEEMDPETREVDNIDTNMIGKEGVVDHIETNMISKTKKSYELDVDQSEDKNKNANLDSSESNEEKDVRDLDNPLGLDFSEDDESDSLDNDNSNKDGLNNNPSVELDLQAADKKDKIQYESGQSDEKKSSSLLLDEELDLKNKNESTVKTDDDELNLKSLDNDNLADGRDKNMTSNGQVEKIDTYYRGGESKKTEHSWDNLTKKSDTVKLDVVNKTRAADGTEARTQKDLGEITIDYRKLKEEFDLISNGGSLDSIYENKSGNDSNKKNYDDAGSFRVVEIDSKGLDFSINIVNAIYDKDFKSKKIFSLISNELVSNYKCIPVFYTYKLSDKKFTEVFNAFLETNNESLIPNAKKEWWLEYKKDTALFEHFQSKSMTHWRCADVIMDSAPWEDVELPTWAEQELKNKHVELIFPYFDGIDRMGLAIVILPDGVDPKLASGMLTTLEIARTLFLDTIERYQVKQITTLFDEKTETVQEEKKGVLNFFGGLFGKKKAG